MTAAQVAVRVLPPKFCGTRLSTTTSRQPLGPGVPPGRVRAEGRGSPRLALAAAAGVRTPATRVRGAGGEGGLVLADGGGGDDGVEGAVRGVIDVPADHDVGG